MDLLFPDAGLVYQLQQILTPRVHYHLFVNTYVPTLYSTVADLTEASFSGYTPAVVHVADFTITGVAGHNGYAIAPPVTFLNSSGGAELVYGYYVTDQTDTILLAIALFDGAPISISSGGNQTVLPTWGDFSQLAS